MLVEETSSFTLRRRVFPSIDISRGFNRRFFREYTILIQQGMFSQSPFVVATMYLRPN